MKYLLLTILLVGCKCNETQVAERIPAEDLDVAQMRCVDVSTNYYSQYMQRCENSEVICYTNQRYEGSGLSCKFKEQTNE